MTFGSLQDIRGKSSDQWVGRSPRQEAGEPDGAEASLSTSELRQETGKPFPKRRSSISPRTPPHCRLGGRARDSFPCAPSFLRWRKERFILPQKTGARAGGHAIEARALSLRVAG